VLLNNKQLPTKDACWFLVRSSENAEEYSVLRIHSSKGILLVLFIVYFPLGLHMYYLLTLTTSFERKVLLFHIYIKK